MKTESNQFDKPRYNIISPGCPHAPSVVQSNSKYWRTKEEEDKTNKRGSSQVVVSGDKSRQTIQKKQALGAR